MDPQKIALVQSTLAQMMPVADEVTRMFYDRLFEQNPHMRILFPPDMMGQREKFMATLSLAMQGLGQPESIAQMGKSLGVRHVHYGVTPDHYGMVGEALLWSLGKELGRKFTPEVAEAWQEAYGVLTDMMAAGAAEVG